MTYEDKLKSRVEELEKAKAEIRTLKEKLRLNEKITRTIFKAVGESVLIIDGQGVVVELNGVAAEGFGRSQNEMKGKCIFDFMPAEVAKKRKEIAAGVFEKGRPERFEDEWKGKNLKHTLYPQVDAQGIVRQVVIFTQDMTASKSTRKALEETEELKHTFFDSAKLGIVVFRGAKVTDCNRKALEMFRCSRGQLIGSRPLDFSPAIQPEGKESRLMIKEKLNAVLHNKVQHFEWQHTRTDGTTFLAEVSLSSVDGSDGTFLAIIKDITEKKWAEERLRKERDFSQTIIQSSPAFFVAISPEGKTILMNEAMFGALGFSREEVIGKDYLTTFVPSDQREQVSEVFRKLTGKQPQTISENRIITRDGGELLVEWHGRPVFGEAGTVDYFIGLGIDITERKKAEEALKESETKYRNLVENVPVGVFKTDLDGMVHFANRFLLNLLGCDSLEKLNETGLVTQYKRPSDRDELLSELRKRGSVDNFKVDILLPSGEEKHLSLNARIEEGFISGIGVDITELKRAEEEKKALFSQLQQAQKLEAIGTLAGGIAHDFNNILSAILGYAELGKDDIPSDSALHHSFDQIVKASFRARDLIKQILTFSRQGEGVFQPVKMSSMVKETLKLLHSSLPRTIEIRHIISGRSDTILADPTQIHQVLMNLCTNAHHAMRENGGLLQVELGDVAFEKESELSHLNIQLGRYVHLRVHDTGHGMDSLILERIFDPYFSTKAKDAGTGLGLAVTRGIVKSHGGAITVQSEPGKGTTFDVYFPLIEQDLESGVQKFVPVPRGNECILFVDDEETICDIAKQMMEHLGYKAETQMSSVEALAAFEANPQRYDLVITDMTMPNMTGDRLAKDLLDIRPDIPIILCTGFSENITEQKAKCLGIKGFLMKPIVVRELGDMIRRVLDE